MNYTELLGHLAPEIILSLTALVVLMVDLGVMREEPQRNRFWVCTAFALVGSAAAIAWLFMHPSMSAEVIKGLPLLSGMLVDDSLSQFIKVALIVFTICAMIISLKSKFTDHVGEYLSLMLLGTVGMMLLVSSTDLLMVFIALELTSLSLYILTAFNKQNIKSIEAALKYFLFGGTAAAFTLFGLSLIYGVSGSTNFTRIAASLNGSRPLDPLLAMAIIMTVIGFGFKIAAVPFHLWAPDAYQGAPTPSAALIASGSKLASFFALVRLMQIAFASANGNGAWHHYTPGWLPLLAILAAASMIVGNLAAIVQSDIRRLLAYSAIAQAGYALLGLMADNQQGMASLIFFMITYGLTVIGAFGVVAMLEQNAGDMRLADFAGLSRREPVLSFCMLVFLLSLAGIPPLAGFFGKFYLFIAVVNGAPDLGWLWLVIIAIAMSAVSLYYYLQVLKQIYVVPAPVNAAKIQVPLSGRLIIVTLAISVVIFGCAPNLLLKPLMIALQQSGF